MLISIPSWSKTDSKNRLTATIDLTTPMSIQGEQLQPGTYKVVADGNEAKFERDGKVVAQVPCTFKTLTQKAQMDDFRTDNNRLTQIDVSGKTQAIVFGS